MYYTLRFSTIWEKITVSMWYLIAYVLILYGYHQFIVPVYGYQGFEWRPNTIKIIEGVLFTCFLPLLLSSDFNKPSDFLLHLQLLFPIIPMFVLYGCESQPRFFVYYTVIAYLLVVVVATNVRIKSIRLTKVSPIFLQRLLLILSWIVIGTIVVFGGLKYLNFDFSKVYDIRSEAANRLPEMFGYISPFTYKVFLPFALLLAVINKEKVNAFLAILGSIVMFGLTAHKSPLFYPFAVLLVYFLARWKNPISLLLKGYVFIIVASIINFTLGGKMIGSLMLRRVYLTPASINYNYYDFFSSNPFALWAQSKITFGAVEYDYDLDVSHLIGSVYYGSELAGANTGWIGSGYMNGGLVGMLVYSVIIGLLISLLDTYGRTLGKAVVVAILFPPLRALMVSSDLPSAFLNHGVILSIFIFMFFSVNDHGKKEGVAGNTFSKAYTR